MEDNSFKWLLTSINSADEENRHVLQEEGNSQFSARIIDFGPSNSFNSPFVKIEGIGYGKHGGTKTAIAQYELEGLEFVTTPEPMYGLYIGGDGYDFNTPIHVIGDVYFDDGFRFNSNASGSVIDGHLKTGSKATLSEFNGGLTVNGNALFQTPIKLQNYNLIINGKAGFKRPIEISKNIILADNGYFASSINGASKVDLSGYIAYHTGSCQENDFQNYNSIENFDGNELSKKVNIPDGDESPIQFNIGLVTSYAKEFSTLGFTDLTASNLQTKYDNTPANQKWNGFLVIKVSSCTSNPNFNYTNGVFNGKVIWIIEKSMGVNQKWYESTSNAINIIYVKNGTISQMGWEGAMQGLIYVTGTGSIIYSFKTGSSIEGSILHVNAAGFQANTSNLFTIAYNSPLLENLDNMGLITLPTHETETGILTLVDCKIRPKLLSIQIM
jgi:hypothetical protein